MFILINNEDFLKTLMKENVFSLFKKHFGKEEKFKSLDEGYVNFSHWGVVAGSHDTREFTKEGLYSHWLRHMAFFLSKQNFPRIDLLIPLAFRHIHRHDSIGPESMSYIIISVKNKESGDGIQKNYMTREDVEGIVVEDIIGEDIIGEDVIGEDVIGEDVVVETPTGTKRSHDGTVKGERESNPKPQSVKSNNKSNLALTLHSLKFVNPKVVSKNMDLDGHWIESSRKKPYIAFVMSLGDTNHGKNLFVAENNVLSLSIIQVNGQDDSYNAHRIVFALRGLTSTYNMYNRSIENSLQSINIRHDVSGQFPLSAPDNPGEREIIEAGCRPLDAPDSFMDVWGLANDR
jgi:hypothetical protein